MMSLRNLARTAPRALSSISSAAVRQSGSGAAVRVTALSASRVLRPQQASAFSTSLFRPSKAGVVDEELSAKLASEIEFEQDVKENEPLPASIKDFLQNGPFEVQDTPGNEEVILTRTFGNEKITVSFSIADLQNDYENDMYDEDAALGDDEVEGQQGRNNGEREVGEEGEDEELADSTVPCRLNVVIEKAGKGALTIEAVAQDGSIVVDNMYYYKDGKLAHGATADAVHAASDAYPGPPFGNLDEDLQILVERYLEDRGIDHTLAQFVPDYIDMKEQKEYLAWLSNVKGFIDA